MIVDKKNAFFKGDRGEVIPVSTVQEYRLAHETQSKQASIKFNLYEVNGVLDDQIFKRAVEHVVRKHEIFRTFFENKDGKFVQTVSRPSELRFEIDSISLTALEPSDQNKEIWNKSVEINSKAFELGKLPLFRFCMFRLTTDRIVFLESWHNLIHDSEMSKIFLNEIIENYESIIQGKPPIVQSGAKLEFADFALWERSFYSDEYLKSHLDYWKVQLQGIPDALNLPYDFLKREASNDVTGVLSSKEVYPMPSTWNKVLDYTKADGSALMEFFLSAALIFLHRITGDDDICIGTPLNIREFINIPEIMGPMQSFFPIRSSFQVEDSFVKFQNNLKQFLTNSRLHAIVPLKCFFEITERSNRFGHVPLFNTIFEIKSPSFCLTGEKLRVNHWGGASSSGEAELKILIINDVNQPKIIFEYDESLFQSSTVESWLSYFNTLINSIINNPEERIGKLKLLSEVDKSSIIRNYCGVTQSFQTFNSVQELFEQQVERVPSQVAIESDSGRFTYKELNERANQLARFLREKGVDREKFVGVLMTRSLDLVVSMLAIFKAGGVYVPLDPAYPEDRLALILREIEAPVILTKSSFSKNFNKDIFGKSNILNLEEIWSSHISKLPKDRPEQLTQILDAAYMIYTSGSTGQPKGCIIEHRGFINLCQWRREKFSITEFDRIGQKTSLSFDLSLIEIMAPLVSGATLYCLPDGTEKDPAQMVRLIHEKSITMMSFVPPMLQLVLEEKDIEKCRSLKKISSGGEALSLETLKRFFQVLPSVKLINAYGPTETTIGATAFECSSNDERILIGYPIPNCRVYIVDKAGELVPPGVFGELYIGGIQVGRGYFKRDALTAEKFLTDPFSGEPGDRVYRTGDRGRYLTNGAIEFQGRIDFQVKVRGFRIELGEVEAALLQHEKLIQAAVVAKKLHGDQNPTSLVAYYRVKEGISAPSWNDLRAHLSQRLPEFMIPAAFIKIETMPLSPSGKADRKNLQSRKDEIENFTKGHVDPEGEIEVSIANIWKQVLKIESVSSDESFFEIGGNSISLIRVFNQIKALGYPIKLVDIYKNQTIEKLSKLIIEKRRASKS